MRLAEREHLRFGSLEGESERDLLPHRQRYRHEFCPEKARGASVRGCRETPSRRGQRKPVGTIHVLLGCSRESSSIWEDGRGNHCDPDPEVA